VQIDLDTLPNDAAILQKMLREVVTATTQQHAELHAENDKLRLLIQRLMRHQFGRRSEQLDADQLQFGLEDLEQTVAENQDETDNAASYGDRSTADMEAASATRPLRRYLHDSRSAIWRMARSLAGSRRAMRISLSRRRLGGIDALMAARRRQLRCVRESTDTPVGMIRTSFRSASKYRIASNRVGISG
jgi:hypothetical protein